MGTWLAFAFAALVSWRAVGASQGGKEYLRNVLIGIAVLSVVAGVLLLRGKKPQSFV